MKPYQELTYNEFNSIVDEYNIIKKEIRTLANNKANYSKTHLITEDYMNQYKNQLKDLQDRYKYFEIPYICNNCNKVFNLSFTNFKKLIKDPNYKFCCSKSCATTLKDNLYYTNTSKTLLNKRNKKISETFKQKINEDENFKNLLKENGRKNLENYWKDKTPEERSEINKRKGLK